MITPANPEPPAAGAAPILTVAEFCQKYRLGRSTYQEMKRRGETPKEMRVGGRYLILPEAEAAWIEATQKRTRELEQDRFAPRLGRPPAGGWPAPPAIEERRFPSGKKIGRPRKDEAAH